MEIWFEDVIEHGGPIAEPTEYVLANMLLRDEAATMSADARQAHTDQPLVTLAAGAWANFIRAWIADRHPEAAHR